MVVIKASQVKIDQPEDGAPEQSIYVSNSKIDKNGEAWTKQAVWLRQEHLNKLKVVAHFQDKDLEQLLDSALGDFVNRIWDNTMAREKLVKAGTDTINKVPDSGK